ncbi:MAG TPA: hypothetical protein VIF43_04420 [Patescibacteria group bacterium]|jgi:hypothetical protein
MAVATGRKPRRTIGVEPSKDLFIYRLTGILLVVLCLTVTWTQDFGTAWRMILTAVAVVVLAAVLYLTGRREVGWFWPGLGLVAGALAMAGVCLQPIHIAQKLIGWAILGYACIRIVAATKRKET